MPDETNTNSILADYLSEQEFADQIGRTLRTVRRWHAYRQGPPRTQIGKKILYKRDSVSKWLTANEAAA